MPWASSGEENAAADRNPKERGKYYREAGPRLNRAGQARRASYAKKEINLPPAIHCVEKKKGARRRMSPGTQGLKVVY